MRLPSGRTRKSFSRWPEKIFASPRNCAAKISGRAFVNFPRFSHLHEPALIDYRNAVRQRQGLLLIVGYENSRDASLALNVLQFHLHLLAQAAVERPQRLIEQRTFGRVTSARARATRCCCPPDNSRGLRSFRPVSRTN